jgi:murein DD-endopeptidase MepM/ murein hydrolase activator NlpD
MDDRYYIKVVPHRGDTIHRFVVRKLHLRVLAFVASLLVLAVAAGALVDFEHLRRAAKRIQQDRATLSHLAGETAALHRELQHVQHENAEITQLIGVPEPRTSPAPTLKASWASEPVNIASIEHRVASLADASQATSQEAARIKTLALRVLNLRHVRALARARLLAYIPSIDPVDGAPIVGCFCYRTYPDVEFHEGVDLGANYGDPVHAAAAGTVAFAGWDGGYGMKIDIDHGNGYHTWYAHLSRFDVSVGQHVYKGEVIAAVGDTGFATGPHLHYQIMYDGTPIDPTPFLDGVPATVIASLP